MSNEVATSESTPLFGSAGTMLNGRLPKGPFELGTRLRSLPADEGRGITLPDSRVGKSCILEDTPRDIFRSSVPTTGIAPSRRLCTTKQESFFKAAISQSSELHSPPSYFTWDWALAKRSVEELAEVEPLVIAPGHGKPISGPRSGPR
jgi:hypothetical protein